MRRAWIHQLAALAAVGIVASGCEKGGMTEPTSELVPANFQPAFVSVPAPSIITTVPSSRAYPGTKVQGQAAVCKDASSPAGTYTFSVSATNTVAGDLVASSASVQPGQCVVVFSRAHDAGDPATQVTITENVPAAAAYRLDRVVADDDAAGTRTVSGPAVTLLVNKSHGGFATFYNVAVQSGLPTLTAFPGTETPGQIKVCKAGSGLSGTFNFTITSTGVTGTDQVATAASLAPNTCAIVFIRTASNLTNATLTITETPTVGFSLTNIVRIQSGTTSTINGTNVVTISENTFHGGVVTFNNAVSAVANFGLGQVPYPGTETPGQIKVCKHASSPAGLFTFNITATGTVAGDQVAPTISIAAGQCALVFTRTAATLANATLTVTEVVPSGMAVSSIVRIQSGTTTTLTATAVATISENFFHGGVLTYTNAVLN